MCSHVWVGVLLLCSCVYMRWMFICVDVCAIAFTGMWLCCVSVFTCVSVCTHVELMSYVFLDGSLHICTEAGALTEPAVYRSSYPSWRTCPGRSLSPLPRVAGVPPPCSTQAGDWNSSPHAPFMELLCSLTLWTLTHQTPAGLSLIIGTRKLRPVRQQLSSSILPPPGALQTVHPTGCPWLAWAIHRSLALTSNRPCRLLRLPPSRLQK